MKNPRLARVPIVIALVLCLPIILTFSHSLAVGEGPTYIDGGVSVYGGANYNGSPNLFVHGDVAQFNGWTDSHRDGKYGIADTSNATFTVDIIGPAKEVVYHTTAITDETGNTYFSLLISDNFSFGTYTISYSLEKEGFIGVTPHSPAPDVSYYESRFFVTWNKDDVIEKSDTYKLELFDPQSQSIQFGSSIDIQGKLCPSPALQTESLEASYDPLTGATILAGPDSPIVIGHFSPTANNSSALGPSAGRNVSALLSHDLCSAPFTLSSGVLGLSGNWSLTADAYWMVENDTTHVNHAQTDKMVLFEVAKPIYRSDNIVPIKLDPTYADTMPMDWSPDGDSILFRYYNDSDQTQRLGILELAGRKVTELDPLSALFPNNTTDWIPIDDARFSKSHDALIVKLGETVYRYNIEQRSLEKLIGPVRFFDLNADGSILYNIDGNLVVADSNGQNPRVILRPGESPGIEYGDLSPDGKKLLYRKILDSAYGWSDGVLAYYDIEAKKETVIPNISNGCGYPPKWAPNGFHILYHESSCSRGWPGAILRITDINGSFQEYVVPASNDYPYPFIFSPDGALLLIGFASSGTGGSAESMGGPANFYIMTMAKPVPEFGSDTVVAIIASASIVGFLMAQRFAPFFRT